MPLDQSLIQKIIDEADIAAIIGEYIKLEKKGADFKGICPFHNDSNPSLSVSPSKKVFKCFSCNAAGNVVGFIERYKQIPYIQALKIVADKVGIELKLDSHPANKNQKYYDVTKEVTNFYQFYLNNTKEGKVALEYLHNRGIDDNVIKHFGIGYAGSEKNLLYKTLVQEKGILELDLRTLKLINKGSNNEYYDVFDSRVIFPIDDFYGHVVGYSGRIIEKKANESKYVNSSESEIFKKGNLLYNYSRSVNEIKRLDQVFIFEGFMDVIAAYRANVLNTVATMGTALTKYQVSALTKLTKNIVVCFDGDSAGIEATKHAIRLFKEAGVYVNTVCLPHGIDPDEYLGKYGPLALADYLLKNQVSAVDYLYEIETRNLNINNPVSVENFKKQIFSYLKLFNSDVVSNNITKRMSQDLNMEINYQPSQVDEYIPIPIYTEKTTKKTKIKAKYLIAEEHAIYRAFSSKAECLYIQNNLPLEIYVDKVNRNILYKLYDYYNIHDEMIYDSFTKSFSSEELLRLESILDANNLLFVEKIENLVELLKEYKFEKTANQLVEQKQDENVTVDDIKEVINLKKKIVKFKNKGVKR